MATIPLGNFGNVVAEPRRAANIQQKGVDAEGMALAQVGQVGVETATDLAGNIALQQRRQAEEEARKQQEIQEREAQTAAARVRITKQNDLADAQEQLHQDILTGKVPKDQAEEEWRHRSGEIIKDATSGIDPKYSGVLENEFMGLQRRGASGVRGAVLKKDQEDTRANLMALGEEYQRTAAKDRPRAIAEYEAQLDAMGPAAGMGADDIQKLKQGFREGTAYTQAFGMVRAASRDLGAVRAAREALGSDQFADLDPQKAAALSAQLDGYETNILQRQEIAAQRAARQQEAAMRRAEAAFNTAQGLIDSGVPLAPEEYERLATSTAGTPYAQGLKALQERAREVGGFAAQPIAVQRQQLDQVNAQIARQGATEALVKRRDSLEKVLAASAKDVGEDPLRAGLQRGVITEIPQIDLSSIDGVTRSIAARMQHAQVVQTWAGRPVSPLVAEEAQRLGSMLNTLPAEQKAQAVATISTVVGAKSAQAIAAQISPHDRPLALAMAAGASMTSGETNWLGRQTIAPRPVSTLMLKGQQFLNDKGADKQQAPEKIRAKAAEILGDALSGKAREDVIEGASLIYLGMGAEGQSQDMDRAINLAAGGNIAKHNGRSVVLPPQMTLDAFRDRLAAIPTTALAKQLPDGKVYNASGRAVAAAEFVSSIPTAVLEPAGQGRYFVRSGAGLALNSKGNPITIEVR